MKPSAIIFGRSPFINQVDVEALLPWYTTIGLTKFPIDYQTDYLFSYDESVPIHQARKTVYPHWFEEADIKITPKAVDDPIFETRYEDGYLVVGFKYFSVSLAVNWAVLKGHREIYLVAVDHVETDVQFEHFKEHGSMETELTPESHRAVKKFIADCAKVVPIYQTNPAVKDQWDLPYKPIEELYPYVKA